MNIKTVIISSALLVGAILPSGADAKSFKRGVSESNFSYKAQMEAIAPGVTWFYNWGPSLGTYLEDQNFLEFVPMCWNGSYNEARIRDYVQKHPETEFLLGFNEPNFSNQASMTPQEAAAKWPDVQKLASELGLKLVAPAMNYSPNAPYQSPTKWFDEFVAIVGEDAFDYLAVHSYGGFGVTQELATTFHERYHKPVWLTEFCFWPGESQNTYVAPETQIASMIQTVQWLEKTEWIFRYAWFMATGNSSADKGPNYGLILSGKGEDPRGLSDQGLVYTNLTDFDPDFYNQANEYVPVQNFINSEGIVMGANKDAAVDFPLSVTRFNAGAWLDYQFELVGESATALNLRVGGYGEPKRFDPSISIFTVNEDGTENELLASSGKFPLSGSDTQFTEVSIPLNLAPGRHTIRVKDDAPSQPSGIIISTLKLMTPSSVGEIADCGDKIVDVYSVQGVMVRHKAPAAEPLSGLPAGLYIVDGKKMIKK